MFSLVVLQRSCIVLYEYVVLNLVRIRPVLPSQLASSSLGVRIGTKIDDSL